MTNAVFLNDGTPGRYQTGELTPIGQGAVGVIIPLLFLNFANSPVNISGYTITANMENVSNGDVTAVDGALAVTSGTAGAATWTVTANDTGTDAAFDVVFTLTKSANPTYVSSPTRLLVSDNPSVTASATNLLVGILQSLKDWLTAEKLATETAADGEILQSDGTNSEGTNYLTATSLRKNNYTATAAPGVGDDTADGYAPGSEWIDVTNDKAYVCLDASAGAAVWTETTAAGGGATALDDLTDVVITTPADNELLAYDTTSGDWINQTAAEAGVSATGHTHSYLANIAEDTTPQLGGNLDLNGNVITGLEIGTDVQAYDAGLTDLAGLAVTDGNIPVGDGVNWVAESGATARASLGALPTAADIVAVASSRDIAASDGGKLLTVTATAALNCPNGLGTGLQCAIASHGGTTTITATTTLQYLDGGLQTAASGVVVNTQCTLVHLGANVWVAYGDVTVI